MNVIFPLKNVTEKILHKKELKKLLNERKGKKIVFTNGCFDLLHYGHLHYLAKASKLGDILLVGMNSNKSISKIKGNHRPLNDEKSRLYQIASLNFVDGVILFEEETPINLLNTIQPDILVKGGDYKKEQVIGWEMVEKYGGKVMVTEMLPNFSTTNIERKILKI